MTLNKEDVKKIFQKKRRKKHKIVIGQLGSSLANKNEVMNCVSYVPYKREILPK